MITVYEHLEDFDNAELPEDERIEQLEDAVREYNELYLTFFKPIVTVQLYEKRKKLTDQ